MKLMDQKALVTGASSGIGAAVALALAQAGAAVGVNYASGAERANAVMRAIREANGEALSLRADISREDEVATMFARFVDAFGRIDILVANAGIQKDAALRDLSLKQWDEVIAVNLTGQFLCVREAARRFLLQGASPVSRAKGKIICMSSVHEAIPWAGHANYAASKGGLSMLMKTVAQELAGQGVRVNGIAPGAIRTGINRSVWSDEKKAQKLLELIPYRRIGEAEDVARAAVWLASDESDYVVGTTLWVDGGMSLYPAFVGNG
jgi:glucose 1-dehydrogenase